MKLFVTGASGFVGRNLLQSLVSDGHTVLCLARSETAAAKISKFGGIPVTLDNLNTGALAEKLSGVDIVIHIAAFLGFWGAFEDIRSTNVDLALTVLRAAEIAKVRRMVHISAASVVMRDELGMLNIDESSPYIERQDLAYSYTKALAEQQLMSEVNAVELIILRPPLIWGDGDVFDEKIIPEIKRGRFALFDRGEYTYSVCHVGNLVHAIKLAFTNGVHKTAYFIADAELTRSFDFISARLSAADLESPSLSIPTKLAILSAAIVEFVWRLFAIKIEPPLTKEMVRLVGFEFAIRTEKALEGLGYQPIITRQNGVERLRTANHNR